MILILSYIPKPTTFLYHYYALPSFALIATMVPDYGTHSLPIITINEKWYFVCHRVPLSLIFSIPLYTPLYPYTKTP